MSQKPGSSEFLYVNLEEKVMSCHPWEQTISEYHISRHTKGNFFQYSQAHPKAKLSRTIFLQ